MYVELKINDNKIDFFMEYLQSFKEGIIENIQVRENRDESINPLDEMRSDLKDAMRDIRENKRVDTGIRLTLK
jgi:hypothetical protein